MNRLVSVIVPLYNGEKFISQTIESVLNQTYSDLELIIVNDGSTDSSGVIVEKYRARDPRISVITKSNSGVSDTRNIGLSKAKGDLIAFLDADDVWLPDNLEKKISVLDHNSDTGFVFSNMTLADENLENQTPAPVGKDSNILEDLLLWNGEVIPGPCSNLVIRKECFASGIKFDTRLTTIADQNLCVQLARSYKGKMIHEATWIYRNLKGSMSKSLMVLEKDSLATYRIYKENGYFETRAFEKKCFSNMYLMLSGSWFKDGKNISRGLKFLALALIKSPMYTTGKLLKKII